jgi:hypothetical protein
MISQLGGLAFTTTATYLHHDSLLRWGRQPNQQEHSTLHTIPHTVHITTAAFIDQTSDIRQIGADPGMFYR